MITIYDIAKRTGFSAPTISKAINNHPDISETTKEEILNVAREMGYVPNQSAKSLVTKKSWLIGVIFEESHLGTGIEHPLFGGILNSFKQTIESAGYELLHISQKLGDKILSYFDHCKYRRIDGVLILNHSSYSEEVLQIVNSNLKMVSTNLLFPTVNSIMSENYYSSIEAVKYLYSLGHTSIGHIGGPSDIYALAGRERFEGYREGLRLCGLPFKEDWVSFSERWSPVDGYLASKPLLNLEVRPSSIYCAGDILSVGVIRACREYGVRIPEDISLVSFDDNEIAQHLYPSLTTFRQNRGEIGSTAANYLLKLIDGEKSLPKETRISVRLIERDSVLNLSTKQQDGRVLPVGDPIHY